MLIIISFTYSNLIPKLLTSATQSCCFPFLHSKLNKRILCYLHERRKVTTSAPTMFIHYLVRHIFHLSWNFEFQLSYYPIPWLDDFTHGNLFSDDFFQPESFIKVRPRCESPRREVMYPMNYTPCRYVRISCLRGNPIAIFFIQVIILKMKVSLLALYGNKFHKILHWYYPA